MTLDFRMSTTCVYSDIVLPTATWYEKNDLNTSDMHPFIHPLSAAVDPAWEARTDWDIYKGIAKAFSDIAPEVLGVETDVVLTPILHDTAGELAQPLRREGLEARRDRPRARPHHAERRGRRARLSRTCMRASRSIGPLLEKTGQRRQGHRLEHAA